MLVRREKLGALRHRARRDERDERRRAVERGGRDDARARSLPRTIRPPRRRRRRRRPTASSRRRSRGARATTSPAARARRRCGLASTKGASRRGASRGARARERGPSGTYRRCRTRRSTRSAPRRPASRPCAPRPRGAGRRCRPRAPAHRRPRRPRLGARRYSPSPWTPERAAREAAAARDQRGLLRLGFGGWVRRLLQRGAEHEQRCSARRLLRPILKRRAAARGETVGEGRSPRCCTKHSAETRPARIARGIKRGRMVARILGPKLKRVTRNL